MFASGSAILDRLTPCTDATTRLFPELPHSLFLDLEDALRYSVAVPMSAMTDPVRRYEERKRIREVFPVRPGMDVRVHMKIREGEKDRTQVFEGIVVAMRGSGAGRTFTVRRVVGGIGVERIFPMNSPRVTQVEIVGATKVRRAKLTYLRKSNVRRRTREDQKVLQQALAEQDAQRRAVEKARREAAEGVKSATEAAKKSEASEKTPDAPNAPAS